MTTPDKPDLDQLIAALLADASPSEMARRDDAATAFRAASGGETREPGRVPRARTVLRLSAASLGRRLALAGAALAVVMAGMTAAAYARALPGPAQHLAHSAFAQLGVPDHQGDQLSADTSATPGSRGAATASAGLDKGSFRIIVFTPRARVPAGTQVSIAGRVTEHGHGAALVQVRLYERLAKSRDFVLVATGQTGPLGGFKLESGPLPQTVVFRVLGPGSAHSPAVRVTVANPRAAAPAASAFATLSPG